MSGKIRMVQRPRIRTRLSRKMAIKVVIISFATLTVTLGVLLNFSSLVPGLAATAGDYRSAASGNWNSTGTWERYDGTSWIAAVATPTSADGVITIESGHTVTVTANVAIDQTVVSSGAILTISSETLTIANGTGSDLDVSGTGNLNTGGGVSINSSALITILSGGIWNYNGGTETTSTGWAVNNGGTYVHNVNNVDVPNATWGSSSTLKITGVTNTDPDVQNQTFGNLIYDCPNQTANLDFKDKLQAINGDFTVVNTGTGTIKFDKSSANTILTVSGNYSQTGGTLKMTNQGNWGVTVAGNFSLSGGTFIQAGTDGVPILTVSGNITISGGTLDMSQYTGNTASKGIGTINLYGNLTQTAGTLTETATNVGKGEIYFAKTGTQTFIASGGTISNTVNVTVNSVSILDMGTYIIPGSGTFTLTSGGGLLIGSANGITSSGATGNVQNTGTRSFSTGGNYTYSGTVAQVTGNGLPTTVNNFTMNNSAGVTLTASFIVSNLLTFTSGNITTNAYVISLGTAQSNTGTLSRTSGHVIGYIRRWFSSSTVNDILFPVGTSSYYEGANVSITSVPSGGTVTAKYTQAVNSWLGLELPDAGVMIGTVADGYWEMTPGDGMSGGAWTLNLYANSLGLIMSDYTKTHIIRKTLLADPWSLSGTHAVGTGTNLNPVANRTNITVWGIFAIGSGVGFPLPVNLISFEAKPVENIVECSWQTASELNNDYFTIERSADGKHFSELTRVAGVGTSTTIHKYSYTDQNPLGGTSYYRLKQTDFNGKTETFKIVPVIIKDKQAEVSTIRVSPNPFTDSFIAEFESAEKEQIQVTIFTINGVSVHSEKIIAEKGNNLYRFSTPSQFKAGSYILGINNGKTVWPTVKIICRK